MAANSFRVFIMVKLKVDSSLDLAYEENIPLEGDIELSSELVDLFVNLFGEELLEKCSDLSEGLDGSPG